MQDSGRPSEKLRKTKEVVGEAPVLSKRDGAVRACFPEEAPRSIPRVAGSPRTPGGGEGGGILISACHREGPRRQWRGPGPAERFWVRKMGSGCGGWAALHSGRIRCFRLDISPISLR